MKKKFICILSVALLAMLSLTVCACDFDNQSSIKTYTKPYISEYECSKAYFGEENLLEKFDYIKLVLVDKENAELLYKQKNSDKKSIKGTYIYDDKSSELTLNFGIYEHKFSPTVKISKGQFTISRSFLQKQLILTFKAK